MKKLQQLREAAKLSREELAGRSGVPEDHIKALEQDPTETDEVEMIATKPAVRWASTLQRLADTLYTALEGKVAQINPAGLLEPAEDVPAQPKPSEAGQPTPVPGMAIANFAAKEAAQPNRQLVKSDAEIKPAQASPGDPERYKLPQGVMAAALAWIVVNFMVVIRLAWRRRKKDMEGVVSSYYLKKNRVW